MRHSGPTRRAPGTLRSVDLFADHATVARENQIVKLVAEPEGPR